MHQLPHLYSWIKHERGIPQVMELGCAFRSNQKARSGSRGNLAFECKGSMQQDCFFE
jgi:hypothetical protein